MRRTPRKRPGRAGLALDDREGLEVTTVTLRQRPRVADGGDITRASSVLPKDDAKFLDGGHALVRRRVQAALGHADADRNVDTRWTQIPAHSRTWPDAVGHTTRP